MIALNKITPNNVNNFIEGNANYAKWATQLKNIPIYKLEQYLFRAYLCRQCLKNGSCLKCGCSAPGLFFAPSKQDDNWPPFYYNVFEWNKFKQSNEDYKKFTKLLKDNNITIDSNTIFDVLSNSYNQSEESGNNSVNSTIN